MIRNRFAISLIFGVMTFCFAQAPEISCWKKARIVHDPKDSIALKMIDRIEICATDSALPSGIRVISPDGHRAFVLVGGRDSNSVEKKFDLRIFNEKKYIIQLYHPEIYFANVKWITENLLLIEIWFGRIRGGHIIYDAENEQVIAKAPFRDGFQEYGQYLESKDKTKNPKTQCYYLESK